jgi:hypothetical protein
VSRIEFAPIHDSNYASHSCVRPNDLRISCKRLACPALSYVPLTGTGWLRWTETGLDALVGCMRGLGSTTYCGSSSASLRLRQRQERDLRQSVQPMEQIVA